MPDEVAVAEVFIATGLDGFIARPDGDIDRLTSRPTPEAEDFGCAAFMAGIGALVMGRHIYEKALTVPEWPYRVPVLVMHRSPESVVVREALRKTVRVRSPAPRTLLQDLAATGVARVYSDGGQIVRAFLAAGLVRRMIVTLIPVLLGQGRPLWGRGAGNLDLTLVGVRHRGNGFVQVAYRG
jgi:dihydrofolate reductase